MDLSLINYLAVLVAAVVSFLLGAIWYGPIFGKKWQIEVGMKEEDFKKMNMVETYGTSFILMVIMSFAMAFLFTAAGEGGMNWNSGLTIGLLIGFGFAGTSMGINYTYQNKSFSLWMIDAFYQIIFLGLMGLIHGLWS